MRKIKKLFIVLSVLIPTIMPLSILKSKTANNFMIKGYITSNQLSSLPHFKVYYQGIQTMSNDDGFFSIPLESKKFEDTYSVLICKDFFPTFESVNTIKNLKIKSKKPYKLFRIKKATFPMVKEKIEALNKRAKSPTMRLKLLNIQIKKQYNMYLQTKKETNKKVRHYQKRLLRLKQRRERVKKQVESINSKISYYKKKYSDFQNASPEKPASSFWFISEKRLLTKEKSKFFTIPSDSVIVCLNPKTVSTLKNWHFTLSENFLALPKIILKENLETRNVKRKQSITRSAIKSKLYSFEQSVFHEKKTEKYSSDQNRPELKISLVQ